MLARALSILLCALATVGSGTTLVAQQTTDGSEDQQEEWTWKDAEGNIRTRQELDDILAESSHWMESSGKSGTFANLSGAELFQADLNNAKLFNANLSKATLLDADLSKANLLHADLSNAKLSNANLSQADLGFADLSNADLFGADLSNANLFGADLSGTYLYGVDLSGAIFEPKVNPEIRGIAAAENLELITYRRNPDALAQLRKDFKDGGFVDQERKITYALKRRQAEELQNNCTWSSLSGWLSCGEYGMNRLLFDLTCQYGMSPGRPVLLAIAIWLTCTPLYWISLHSGSRSGLSLIASKTVNRGDDLFHKIRLRYDQPSASAWHQYILRRIRRELHVLATAALFSLMTTFNIGFRELNFGRWIRMIQPREFDIKARGWPRVVSGLQSLLSVGLVALSLLSYFGRPFEN